MYLDPEAKFNHPEIQTTYVEGFIFFSFCFGFTLFWQTAAMLDPVVTGQQEGAQ